MRTEPKTQSGSVLEGPCLVAAAASALTKHRLVEAISIQAVEGKISVATMGRGHGEHDYAAIIEAAEGLAGLRL